MQPHLNVKKNVVVFFRLKLLPTDIRPRVAKYTLSGFFFSRHLDVVSLLTGCFFGGEKSNIGVGRIFAIPFFPPEKKCTGNLARGTKGLGSGSIWRILGQSIWRNCQISQFGDFFWGVSKWRHNTSSQFGEFIKGAVKVVTIPIHVHWRGGDPSPTQATKPPPPGGKFIYRSHIEKTPPSKILPPMAAKSCRSRPKLFCLYPPIPSRLMFWDSPPKGPAKLTPIHGHRKNRREGGNRKMWLGWG